MAYGRNKLRLLVSKKTYTIGELYVYCMDGKMSFQVFAGASSLVQAAYFRRTNYRDFRIFRPFSRK